MSATKGSGFSFRSRGRLIGYCMAAVLLAFAVGAPSASAKKKHKEKPVALNYVMALGDSISYGYSLVKFETNKVPCEVEGFTAKNCEPPEQFEKGFVNDLVNKINESASTKEKKKVLTKPLNLACPGETSKGLIGHNSGLGGAAGSEYNPCEWHNTTKEFEREVKKIGHPVEIVKEREDFRRHEEYGSESQLEAAIRMLNEKPTSVRDVTLQIGSNDELHVVGACENAEYLAAHHFKSITECITDEAPALFTSIITNIGHTIGDLRTAGKYSGPILLLGFYNAYSFLLPGSDLLQGGLDANLEEALPSFGPEVKIANPFTLFNPKPEGSPAEHEALQKYTEMFNPLAEEFEFKKIFNEHKKNELAAVTKFEEEHGSPNLAEVEAAEAPGEPAFLAGLEAAELTGVVEGVENGPPVHNPPFHTFIEEVLFGAESGALGPPDLAEVTAAEEAKLVKCPVAEIPQLACVTAKEEAEGHPNLHEVTVAAEKEKFEKVLFEQELKKTNCPPFGEKTQLECATAASEAGAFEPVVPSLAKATTEAELHASPDLAEVTAAAEAGLLKSKGIPSLAEAIFGEEHAKAAHEPPFTDQFEEYAFGVYFATLCGGVEHFTEAQCLNEFEINHTVKTTWEANAKPSFEALVKSGYDQKVKEGFDAEVKVVYDKEVRAVFAAKVKEGFDATVKTEYDKAVKEGFDKVVKEGFDAAVKAHVRAEVKVVFEKEVKIAFEGLVKEGFDAEVFRVFKEEVEKAFKAAGHPGDIHPSNLGYEEMAKLLFEASI